jgi:hypothetical protein
VVSAVLHIAVRIIVQVPEDRVEWHGSSESS